jgi:hypothetical protein
VALLRGSLTATGSRSGSCHAETLRSDASREKTNDISYPRDLAMYGHELDLVRCPRGNGGSGTHAGADEIGKG